MDMIAAVSENWAIGQKGRLLFNIPDDMKYFREKTLGCAVVMGRKTLDTLPGKRPLEGRTNIIFSSDRELKIDGASIVHDLAELFELIKTLDEKVYIIGGESVFKMLEPYCEKALITKVEASPEADKFFPDLDSMKNWKLVQSSEKKRYGELTYSFLEYRNTEPAGLPL